MAIKCYELTTGLYTRGHIRKIRDSARRIAWLKENNIDIVVAMVKPYMPDVARTVAYYLYCPIEDGKLKLNTTVELLAIARYIAARIQAGKRVLIYCKRGRNRSCFMAALVLRELEHLTGAQAIARIKQIRPNSLANNHFIGYLST